MATTQTKTTTRKEWQPNEKQKAFLGALEVLGEATFREVKDYVLKNNGISLATGSVNVLLTKQYVGTKKVAFNVETTTTYHYPNGDIVETKSAEKEETVYFSISEADRETFASANAKEKASKVKSNPAELDIAEDELVDMEEDI